MKSMGSAGRRPSSNILGLISDNFTDKDAPANFSAHFANVQKDEILLQTKTIREFPEFVARLKLPETRTSRWFVSSTSSNLVSPTNARKPEGVSGDERKRTRIGV